MLFALRLTSAGINHLKSEWSFEMEIKYRELNVKQLQDAYTSEVIQRHEFRERMKNLDYQDKEIDLLENEAIRIANAKAEKAVAGSYSYFTPKTLGEMYSQEILTRDDIERILRIKRWSQEAIDAFLLSEEIE
jgi:hypothetical protein